MNTPHQGKVYLVGAGPGDPQLLTLRGRDVLSRAEAVVYDALVNPLLLEHAPRAEHIYAGKTATRHSLPQEDINALLITLAGRHGTVVRLKGGDPFVFGRGGEEALALQGAGVPFEVVPGITAGFGAAAFAGIPVTHRGLASSVTLLTGHSGTGSVLDLSRLALEGTLACYMSVGKLPVLIEQLLALGRPPETPAAVIEWGTYARQRTVTGTLRDITARCAEAGLGAPAVAVIGAVAGLREQLSWFEARPLFGLRVVVTHTAQRHGLLETRLQELGASIFPFPMLEIAPAPPPPEPPALEQFDWILLTSANAAEMLFDLLDQAGKDARALAGVRLCAVGSATLEALRRRFIRADAQPKGYEPEALLAAMEAHGALAGQRVLFPRSDIARSALPRHLRAAGAHLSELLAYEKRAPAPDAARVEALLAYGPELFVFTNAGAVRNFAQLLGPTVLERLKGSTSFASIGPVTSDALRELALPVQVEPRQHDLPHLVEAICAWRGQQDAGA